MAYNDTIYGPGSGPNGFDENSYNNYFNNDNGYTVEGENSFPRQAIIDNQLPEPAGDPYYRDDIPEGYSTFAPDFRSTSDKVKDLKKAEELQEWNNYEAGLIRKREERALQKQEQKDMFARLEASNRAAFGDDVWNERVAEDKAAAAKQANIDKINADSLKQIKEIRELSKTNPKLAEMKIEALARNNPLDEDFVKREQIKTGNTIANPEKVANAKKEFQKYIKDYGTGPANPAFDDVYLMNESKFDMSEYDASKSLQAIRQKWRDSDATADEKKWGAKDEQTVWLRENMPEEFAKIDTKDKKESFFESILSGISNANSTAYEFSPLALFGEEKKSKYASVENYIKSLPEKQRGKRKNMKKDTTKQENFYKNKYSTDEYKEKLSRFDSGQDRANMISDTAIKEIEKINKMNISQDLKNIKINALGYKIRNLQNDSKNIGDRLAKIDKAAEDEVKALKKAGIAVTTARLKGINSRKEKEKFHAYKNQHPAPKK